MPNPTSKWFARESLTDKFENIGEYVKSRTIQKKVSKELRKKIYKQTGSLKNIPENIVGIKTGTINKKIDKQGIVIKDYQKTKEELEAEQEAGGDPELKKMILEDITYDADKEEYVVHYIYAKENPATGVYQGEQVKYYFSAKKEKIRKIIAKDLKAFTKKTVKKVNTLKDQIAQIEQAKKFLVIDGINIASGIASAALLMGIYPDGEGALGTKPEIIVGGVPLYSVQYIERAKSDRKLKSRAIGDVFLAHQKGNKDILRADLTLSGVYRYAYLWYLIALQEEGRGRTKNVSENLQNKIITSKPSVQEGYKTSNKLLNYETHKTFPVITRNHILLNMYLQTIEWHQSVEDGKNVIKVHLLFRKYFPTTAFIAFNEKTKTTTEGEEEIIGADKLGLQEDYGMAKRWMEYTLDFIWKATRMTGEIFGRLLINDDGTDTHIIDQQALSSMQKMVTSYSGKFLGIL